VSVAALAMMAVTRVWSLVSALAVEALRAAAVEVEAPLVAAERKLAAVEWAAHRGVEAPPVAAA
jgi:hypothetical protein